MRKVGPGENRNATALRNGMACPVADCAFGRPIIDFDFKYYEMSYGLNVEMHKQTEIAKRLNAICAQLTPFLSQEVKPGEPLLPRPIDPV
jgi:hypothetical protein